MALERLSVPAFGGGIRNDLMSQLISPSESWDALNEDSVRVEGACSKRRGTTLLEDLGTGRVQCIYEGEIWDRKRLVACDKIVKQWTLPDTYSAAIYTFTSASDYIDVAPYRELTGAARLFIIFNGVDKPAKWTGTGPATEITAAPTGKCGLWHKTYFIMGNLGATYESAIKWCTSGDVDNWTISDVTTAGSVDIETSAGGDIIAMRSMDLDTFIIYKNDGSIIACYSTGSIPIFGYKTISEGFKLVSGRAIVSCEGYHWALSQEGLLKISSSSVELVDSYGKAKNLFYGRTDNWDDAVAAYDSKNRRILIAYPRTGGTANDGVMVYNVKYNTFDNWTGSYTVLTEINDSTAMTILSLSGTYIYEYIGRRVDDPRLRYVESTIYAGDTSGQLIKFSDISLNDMGSAVSAYHESGWIRVDPKFDGDIWFREINLEVDLLGDYDINLEYRSDYNTSWKSVPAIDTTLVYDRTTMVVKRFINTVGRAIKIRWSNETVSQTYCIRSMYIVYEKMEEKDG